MESANLALAFFTLCTALGFLFVLISFMFKETKKEYLDKQEYYNKNTKGSFNNIVKNK